MTQSRMMLPVGYVLTLLSGKKNYAGPGSVYEMTLLGSNGRSVSSQIADELLEHLGWHGNYVNLLNSKCVTLTPEEYAFMTSEEKIRVTYTESPQGMVKSYDTTSIDHDLAKSIYFKHRKYWNLDDEGQHMTSTNKGKISIGQLMDCSRSASAAITPNRNIDPTAEYKGRIRQTATGTPAHLHTDSKPDMQVYSFRAECQYDVFIFMSCLQDKGFSNEVTKCLPDPELPGTAVEFIVDVATTESILVATKDLSDVHVIRQTLRQLPLDDNSLERDYSVE